VKDLRKSISIARKSIALISFIIVLLITTAPQGMAQPVSAPTIYADVPRIDGTGKIGQNVTVNINISNVVSLWSWQVGISFDNAILNCTSIADGTMFQGKSVLGFMAGYINNTGGYVTYSGNSLKSPETTGVNGSGLLMTFTFEVIGPGISDLHLRNVKINKRVGVTITPADCHLIDVYTVVWDGGNYLVEIVHNSTGTVVQTPTGLFNHNFSQMATEIDFSVSGPSGKKGFCNVTIPKTLLKCDTLSDWIVTANDAAPTYFPTPTDNATHTFIYFEYTTSTVNVKITGTWVIPEFPRVLIMPLLIIAMLAAVILGKKLCSTKRGRSIVAK